MVELNHWQKAGFRSDNLANGLVPSEPGAINMTNTDRNDDSQYSAHQLDHEELQDLLSETQLEATPEQLRAILAFIEEAGGLEEAQELIERLGKAA